jgi:hypothetical protein
MDGCSLFALIACFNWSGFYVDGGLSFQDSSPVHQEWATTVNYLPTATETVRTQYTTDEPLNPYGRFALGYQIEFKSVTLSLEAAHVSSLATNRDRGVNSIGLKARWYPFR